MTALFNHFDSVTARKLTRNSYSSNRVIDNGVETVTVTEDGKIKSKTVNGQPQLTN